ncbi:MAG: hypothetical protein N2652_01720 [Kiritimatiellae bacterium]|nr:hypothetical protein [Kiritimatiellia bacterium]
METGGSRFLAILIGALAVGIAVLVVRPEYRAAVSARWRGRPEESPIWRSNSRYYPGIGTTDAADER